MNAVQHIEPVAELPKLSRDQIKHETSLGLAAEMIERGLQGPSADLLIALLQIDEAGLVESMAGIKIGVNGLCKAGDELDVRAREAYPICRTGKGFELMRTKCRTLADEVDLYRQEQFWTGSDAMKLMRSEQLIHALFRFYADAEFLMRQIDQHQPDYRVVSRQGAPVYISNPYESLFAS